MAKLAKKINPKIITVGLGFAFRSYLRGELVKGVDLVLDAINIADDLKTADVLITGEGKGRRQIGFPDRAGQSSFGRGEIGKKN